MNLDFHHVIPYVTLRDIWNGFVGCHIQTHIPEAQVALRQYLNLCNPRLVHIDSWLCRMRAEKIKLHEGKAVQVKPLDQLQPLEWAELHPLWGAAVWPAWNIVQGPKNRNDCPGPSLDRFKVGLTPTEATRMREIEMLVRPFELFIGRGAAQTPSSLRDFRDSISRARPLVSTDLPIPFRDEMWIQEANGKWRKRLHFETITPEVKG